MMAGDVREEENAATTIDSLDEKGNHHSQQQIRKSTTDKLFAFVERQQQEKAWGSILDAGTGVHSLTWLCTLNSERLVAVTGDESMKKQVLRSLGEKLRSQDEVICGNWLDNELLKGQQFDVIIADYLIGAVEGFAPYFQDMILRRLREHLKPNGSLFIIGLEPFPDSTNAKGGELVIEMARLRDACILLAGHRCYREFPMDWVENNLQIAGYQLLSKQSFSNIYRSHTLKRQIQVARSKLPLFRKQTLANAMKSQLDEYESRAAAFIERNGPIQFGRDYVIHATTAVSVRN